MSPDSLSFRHPKVQRLRRLLSRRSARDDEGVLVVEGARLLEEALRGGARVESVYLDGEGAPASVEEAFKRGASLHRLDRGVLERVADTVAPQPVLAVVSAPAHDLEDLREADLVVVCVDVRDPGNMGTLLRSALAAGAAGVVCCDGSVDVHNPKTVRASAGSLFHVRVVNGGQPVSVLERLGGWGLQRLGAAARSGTSYLDADLRPPTAFVVGNEATGLPDDLSRHIDGMVHIPMAGTAESLNVGVATAVLCFEAARQRRHV